MTARRAFPGTVLTAIQRTKIVGIRAGDGEHRIIGIWAVVVDGRVYVRSWKLAAGGWWRTFQEQPRGLLTVGRRKFTVRAVQTRSERLKDAVSAAYAAQYNTPGSAQYVRDLSRKRSRDTTTELVLG
jgi:hypothetical protein